MKKPSHKILIQPDADRRFAVGLVLLFFSAVLTITPQLFAQDARMLFHEAQSAVEVGKWEIAEALIDSLFQTDSLLQDNDGRSLWYLKGRVLEHQNEPLAAIEILENGRVRLSAAGLQDPFLDYHLARLYAENRVEDKERQITPLVYSAVKDLKKPQQNELVRLLVDQLAFFISPKQQQELQESQRPGRELYRALRRLDPNPLTEVNEFLPLYFRRMQEARRRYPDPTTIRGYDIRGDLLVRLGQPWKIYSDHSGLLGEVGYAIYPFEVWFFSKIHPDLYFTLLQERGHGYYKRVDGPESVLGTFYKGKRAFFNKLRPGETATLLRLHLYEELAAYHYTFRRRIDRLREQMTVVDAADYARTNFIVEDREHRVMVDSLLPRIAPVLNEIYDPLTIQVSWARFYAPEQDVVECSFGVPNSELLFQPSPDGYSSDLFGEVAVLNQDFEPIAADSLFYRLSVSGYVETQQGRFIGQWRTELDTGSYHLYLKLVSEGTSRQAVFREHFRVNRPPSDSLVLSDLQFALAVEPAAKDSPPEFVKQGLFVSPMPGDSISQREFFVYAELLIPQRFRKSTESLHISGKLATKKEQRKGVLRILGLFGKRKDQEKQLFTERISVDSREVVPLYHQIALPDTKPGRYVFLLEVQHPETGERVLGERNFVLGKE